MKKTRSISFQTIVRVFLQSLAVLTLLVAIGWLVVEPGFEPALAILGSIAVLVSPLFLKLEEKDSSESQTHVDECEAKADIQLDALHVGNAEMGGGGVANFLHDYQVYFGGRQKEMEELDAWLAQTNRPFGLLVAPAGMGKSALVANWSERLKDSGEAIVVYHPISLRYGTNSQKQTLRSLLEQMSEAARKEAALESEQPYVSGLDLVDESFNKEELQELCFHLSVDYDNLGEGGKRSKAQELIRRYQWNRCLDELVDLCRRMRPQHDWDAAFARSTPDRLLYEPPQEGNSEQLLIDQLQKNLRQSTGWDKPLVVVIDGLDELANQLNQPRIKPVGFLPNQVGEGIYLLAVARGESNDVRDDWERALGWERSPVHPFTLGALQKKDIREMVSWSRSGIESEFLDPLADKIYALSEEGDPLIASLWLDWLAKQADRELSSLLEDLEGQSPGINTYIDGVLSQINPLVSEAAKPLFEVLSLARGPLTARDLYALGIKIDSGQLNLLVNLSGRLIIRNEYGYVIGHSRIRQAIQDKLVSPERREYWLEQFHRYGRCALKQAKNAVDGKIPTVSPYLLSYYAEHLQEDKPSGYETSLYALVDEVWMKAHYEYSRSYDGFLDNVQRVWNVAEEVGKQIDSRSTLAIQFKCALVSSKAVSLSGHYLLPALLLRDELLRLPSQALAQIDLLPNIPDRIDAWLALLEIEEARKKLTPRLISQIVDRITFSLLLKEETQAKRFRKLYRLMALDETFDVIQIKNMKEVADGFTNPLWRAWGLSVILPLFSDPKDGTETIIKIIISCLKIKEGDTYSHLPYLYETFATNLPIDLFSTACQQAFADVDTLNRRDFFEKMAWEIPPEKTDAFITVLYEHLRCFPHIAELISNMAPKIGDEQAIHIANEFAIRFKGVSEEYGEKSVANFRRAEWVYGAVGCGPIFIVLAAQRKDLAYKERLLDFAHSFITEFGADELPLNQEDLWTLYRIVKGELTDETVAALVLEEKFLRQYFKENRLNVYSHAVLYCLGSETITALFKPAIRPDEKSSEDGRFQWIDKSGYVLPLIASRFSDDEWPFISRIGSADFGLGYLRAAAKNFCRLRMPERFINELFKNWLGTDRVFGEGDDVLNDICVTIAPYVKVDDLLETLKQRPWSQQIILLTRRMTANPQVNPEVLKQVTLLPFHSEEQKATADIYYIWVLRDEEKRKVLLKKLQQFYASTADCIDQLSFLSRLTTTTKSLRNHWRLDQYHRQIERRLHGRGYGLWMTIEKLLSIIWSTIFRPVSRFLGLVARIGLFKALLNTVYNVFGFISLPVLFPISMYQKVRYRKLDLMKDQEKWKQFQREIQRINQIQSTDERRVALAKFTDQIIDLGIAYPHNVFQKYVLTAEKQNLWERFVYPEDALIVLENPRQYHLDFKAYSILIPAMVTRIDRTKYSLEMLLDAVSEVALDNFVLNQIVLAYFLEGDEQIQVIEAAIQNSQDFSWVEDEDVGNAIHALAYFVPQDLVSVILDWLQVFSSASTLAVLAPKIIAHKDSEELLKQAISILERLSEKSPVHRFVCNIASELKGKDIAALIELVLKRDVPLRSQEINWGYGSQNPDQPLESYACLLKRWIFLAENEETKSEAFVAWNLMLRSLARRPCKDFFDHMQWFVEVIPKLGSEQDSVVIGETILEVGRWKW